jgi:hypothetical protein
MWWFFSSGGAWIETTAAPPMGLRRTLATPLLVFLVIVRACLASGGRCV